MANVFDATFDATFRGATVSSIALTSPTASKVIKIKATKDGMLDSAEATYSYVITGTVATPAIVDGEDGTFTITCATEGASIYYTTNGDTPTEDDTLYEEAVTLEATATVKAKAFKTDWAPSEVASQEIEVASWTPADITGVESWYSAEALSLTYDADTKKVSEWADKIGGAKKYVQATGGNQPAWDAAKNAVIFNNVSTTFITRSGHGFHAAGDRITFWFYLKFTGLTSAIQVLWSHAGSGVMRLATNADLTSAYLNNGAAGCTMSTNATAMQAGYVLIIGDYYPDNTSEIIGYGCGASGADVSDTGDAGNRTFNDANGIIIGSYTTTGSYLAAEVKAFGTVVGAMGNDDKAALKAYYMGA